MGKSLYRLCSLILVLSRVLGHAPGRSVLGKHVPQLSATMSLARSDHANTIFFRQ